MILLVTIELSDFQVWPDFLTVVYIIRKPPDFTDAKEFAEFQVKPLPYFLGSFAPLY